MKKIALMMLVAIAAIACNKQDEIVPEINVTTTEFTVPVEGSEEEPFLVQFNANVAWTAALKEASEWCSIAPNSGVAGDATLSVYALENELEETRSVTIVITAGSAVKEVTVTQEAVFVPRISVSPEYPTIPLAGGSVTVEVTANLEYQVNVPEDATWLTYTKEGNVLTFTAATANEAFSARTATVTFTTALEEVACAATVSQEGRAAKLWTKKVADLEGFDVNKRVKLARYGDLLAVANTTKVYAINPATGEVEKTINIPEGFNADNVLVDDAGNFLLAADVIGTGDLTLFYVPDPFNPAPQPIFTYNSGNYYAAETGNIRVKGNILDDAVITAVASDGAGGALLAWEIVDGVCSDWKWTNVPYTAWSVGSLCAAPAGPSLADGIFYIGYGGNYNLKYTSNFTAGGGSTWVDSYVTGSSWMENYNCISIAEWKGNKYLAVTAGCHFNYDDADAILLNVNDPAAAQHVYTYSGTNDVTRDENWANTDWIGNPDADGQQTPFPNSDILIFPTADAFVMVYVDAAFGAMSCVALR